MVARRRSIAAVAVVVVAAVALLVAAAAADVPVGGIDSGVVVCRPGGGDAHTSNYNATRDAHAADDESWTAMFVRSLRASFENQFIGGSLVLTITGAIMALLFSTYHEANVYINNRLYITLDVPRTQEIYHWLTSWLVNHDVVQRSARFAAATSIGPDHDDAGYFDGTPSRRRQAKVLFLPVGTKTTYKVFFRGTIVWISIETEGEMSTLRGMFFGGGTGPSAMGRTSAPGDNRGYVLRTFNMDGRGRDVLSALLQEAQAEYNKRSESTVELFIARYGAWERIGSRPRRKLSSVILNGDEGGRLLADMREFLDEGSWYAARGIPHRRGYLLYGPPGCGKTSFITAVAGELQLPLCMLSLSDPSMDGYTFTRLMNTAPQSAIIVLEDVDAAFVSRTPTRPVAPADGDTRAASPTPHVTLGAKLYDIVGGAGGDNGSNRSSTSGAADSDTGSGLTMMSEAAARGTGTHNAAVAAGEGTKLSFSDMLNALDGLAAQEGRLFFMTTNHRSRLDPALIRPGRIDMQLEFAFATTEQARRLFEHFFGDYEGAAGVANAETAAMAEQFAQGVPAGRYSMATLQGFLMQHRRSPSSALAHLGAFLNSTTTSTTTTNGINGSA